MTEEQIIKMREQAIAQAAWSRRTWRDGGLAGKTSLVVDAEEVAHATLEADRAAGLKLMEREPTEEMIDAAAHARDKTECRLTDGDDPLRAALIAAFDAAPSWPGAKK